ncbi:ubiquitin-like-conjugating enzyme ATG10 [Bicyclus anynana]|uniref:Ubiquitin-like-conjugating enzyme ATG10 n=1 Tax=Bicyclus anynana TaxID=110368 RepID=A0A6J1NC15_BICAN|nr:ubiquitin-like-conjugating enzyme ATG10 [Bicyclus anynana]
MPSSNSQTTCITLETYLCAAKDFIELSAKFMDEWTIHQDHSERLYTHLKKEDFITHVDDTGKETLFRAEYAIFYNLSYGVPSFSFNVWDCTGKLLTLEEVRGISPMNISTKDFYSVVTQQEHPVFHRPYFIIHPCHTAELLSMFKKSSKNIIITFLSLITPLIQLKLPLEYGLSS